MRKQLSAPAPKSPSRKRMQFAMVPGLAIMDGRLKNMDVRVLAALAINADKSGLVVRSQVRLANELGIARSTLHKSITRLKDTGWLISEQQSRPDGGNCSSRYFIQRDFDPDDAENSTSERAGPADQGGPPLSPNGDTQKNKPTYTKFKKPEDGRNLQVQHPHQRSDQTLTSNGKENTAASYRTYKAMVKKTFENLSLDTTSMIPKRTEETLINWYEEQFHPELDIAHKVAELYLELESPPISLAYFTNAIRNSHRTRMRFEAEADPEAIRKMHLSIELTVKERAFQLALQHF